MKDDSFRINDLYLLATLAVLSISVRLATLEYVEIGGDSLEVWMNIRAWAEQGSVLEWFHKTSRWAVTIPLLAVMKLFGTRPENYYILPVAYATAGALLGYGTGRLLLGRAGGLLTGLLLILYPKMATAGSQLWPGIYVMTYLLASVLLILLWRRKGAWPLLACAGILFGLAWASRVMAIYYLPGLLLLIWAEKRNPRALMVFLLSWGVVLGLEWVGFVLVAGDPLGRIGVITATHAGKAQLRVTPIEYFLNFINLIDLRGLLPVFLAGAAASVHLLRKGNGEEKGISLLFLGALFFTTYMPASISPLALAAHVGTRYLTAAVPYLLLALLLVLERLRCRHPRLRQWILGGLVAAFAVFTVLRIPATNSLAQVAEDARIMGVAVEQDLPVVMRYFGWKPNMVEGWIMKAVGVEPPERAPKRSVDTKMLKNARRLTILYNSGGDPATHMPPLDLGHGLYLYRGTRASLKTSKTLGVSDFERLDQRLYLASPETVLEGTKNEER